MTILSLLGHELMLLDGGPHFRHDPTGALYVTLADEAGRRGWLEDRFGVSWQVVPRVIGELMRDPERAKRVTAAYLPMGKLDLAALLRA